MIFEIVDRIANILNQGINLKFKYTQDMVKVQSIDAKSNEGAVHITVVNIERDTNAGISFHKAKVSANHTARSSPSWDMNVYILIAAVFPQKQYAHSLKIIMEVFKILQGNSLMLDFNQYGLKYSIEPYNTSLQELSHVWGLSGGGYFPSMLYKIKTLTIEGGTPNRIDTDVVQREVNYE